MSADPRAVRTRKAIIAAVDELVEKGMPAPTVSDIVRVAGVSRSSFYTQFADLDELAAVVFLRAFSKIDMPDLHSRQARGMTRAEATRMAVAQLVAHVAGHRGYYRRGLLTTASGHDEVLQALAARLVDSLPLVSSVPDGVSIEGAAAFIAGGLLAILRAWVLDELAESEAGITNEIVALLPGWLVSSDSLPRAAASPARRARRSSQERRARATHRRRLDDVSGCGSVTYGKEEQ